MANITRSIGENGEDFDYDESKNEIKISGETKIKERVIALLKQYPTKEILEGDWWASSLEPIIDTAPFGFDLHVFIFDTLVIDSPYSIVVYSLYVSGDDYLSANYAEPIFTHSLPAKDLLLWMDKDYEPSVYFGKEDDMLKEAITMRFSEVTCGETVSEYVINQAVEYVLETADKDLNTNDVKLAVSRVIKDGFEALEPSIFSKNDASQDADVASSYKL